MIELKTDPKWDVKDAAKRDARQFGYTDHLHDALAAHAYKQAIEELAAQYPTDIFPEDGTSIDSRSAKMARVTCRNIESRAAEILKELTEET